MNVNRNRPTVSCSGTPPGSSRSATAAKVPPMTKATTATTTACSTTPVNSRAVEAPMAFSTPYSEVRSRVSRQKNSPTTASTTTSVE